VGRPADTTGADLDEARFRGFYDAHFGFVWGLVRSFGVAPRHQADVVQEIWVQAYRMLQRLRTDASARAWLAAITRRAVQNHLHAAQRDVAGPVSCDLDDDRQLAYVLVHGYGLSVADAARALDVSVNTLCSRLRSAQQWTERTGIVLDRRDDEGEAQHASGRVLAGVLEQTRGDHAAVLAWLACAVAVAAASLVATGVLLVG
jgi:DNA-directed RNA polymerase specialized sigma24 family protein